MTTFTKTQLLQSHSHSSIVIIMYLIKNECINTEKSH